MPFTDSHRCKTMITKNLGNESGVLIDTTIETRETCGVVGDTAHTSGVLITTGEETRACWRTHSRGVKTPIAQTLFGETVEVRRLDIGTKAADLRVANIVKNDEDHIRCSLWRKHDIGIRLHRIFKSSADYP